MTYQYYIISLCVSVFGVAGKYSPSLLFVGKELSGGLRRLFVECTS